MKNVAFYPNTMQIPPLKGTSKFTSVLAPIQSGKTTLAVVWLIREIKRAHDEKAEGDFLLVAPTHSALTRGPLEVFKNLVRQLDWGNYSDRLLAFQLKWGPRVFFRSEQAGDYEGMQLAAAAIDDPVTDRCITEVQARLLILQGRLLTVRTAPNDETRFRMVYQ